MISRGWTEKHKNRYKKNTGPLIIIDTIQFSVSLQARASIGLFSVLDMRFASWTVPVRWDFVFLKPADGIPYEEERYDPSREF